MAAWGVGSGWAVLMLIIARHTNADSLTHSRAWDGLGGGSHRSGLVRGPKATSSGSDGVLFRRPGIGQGGGWVVQSGMHARRALQGGAPGRTAQSGSATSSPSPGGTAAPRIPAVFAFGDANAETGNDNYRNDTPLHTDFYPFGRTFFGRPSGRVTDGRITLDFLTQFLGLPLLPPSLQPGADLRTGASFATGGASATNNAYELGYGYPLQKQIGLFLRLANQSVVQPSSPLVPSQQTLRDALYVIQIGEVNYLELFTPGAVVPGLISGGQASVQAQVLASIQEAISKLYSAGARKFLVFAIYPLACAPLLRAINRIPAGSSECISSLEDPISAFNAALDQLLTGLRRSLPGTTFLYARADQILREVLASPASFGFSNTLDGCCGSGVFNGVGPCGQGNFTVCPANEKRIYWDQLHNTEAFFSMVASEITTGNRFIRPFNVSTLAAN